MRRWFGRVFERYNLPEGSSGYSNTADQDYFKFLGHEMFVSIVAFLLREERWNLLGDFVAGPVPMRYLPDTRGPANAEWFYASQHLPSLIDEGTRRRRVSLHADMLNERRTTGSWEL